MPAGSSATTSARPSSICEPRLGGRSTDDSLDARRGDWPASRRHRRAAAERSAGPAVPGPGDRPRGLRPGRRLLAGDDRERRGDDRRDRGPDRRRGRRLQPGRRLRDHDRGGRPPRPGADGPVGHRPEGLRRRARDPVRPRPEPRARPGASCTAAPATGRRTSTTPRSSGSSTRTCCRCSSRATSTARSRSPWSGSTRTRRRSTPSDSSSPARSTPRSGSSARPSSCSALVGSGVFAWLRYGRDPVYLDDPSIHMAGPPRDLTPAAGAFVDRREDRRAAR